ncbi:MAG: ABC transporter ATP-binding protein [Syntrophales bacterium]|jgi:ABC-2 type transport system ATP-binding protein|nr:ABC transporter ATP-binding protein [Syntrophales bacterium]MDY0044037.1 ABC transporter ATP-binding protein [Syntrophales bacterium]
MRGETIIETRGLTKVYGSQKAVSDLTFSVKEGEIFGFLGPNGSGKTTTLLMLLGLTEPTSGWARVAGFDPLRESMKVKRIIGYIPENIGFYEDMNAVENLRFIARLNGLTDKVSTGKIMDALETVGLSDEATKKVGAYSRGMRQRLGIAEIMIKEPKIAFLDEPTLGLDPEATTKNIGFIQALSKDKNITVILSSHDLKQVQKIAARIGIMLEGKMIAEGTFKDLTQEKFGVGDSRISLDDLYMKYFQEV